MPEQICKLDYLFDCPCESERDMHNYSELVVHQKSPFSDPVQGNK